MRLEFDFPDEWASSMPATGVAVPLFSTVTAKCGTAPAIL